MHPKFCFLVLIWGTSFFSSCVSRPVPNAPFATHEYRLQVWPAFSQPSEFLVQRDTFGNCSITQFKFTGQGAYSPRRKGAAKVHPIPAARWEEFCAAFARHEPWQIPQQQGYTTGTDGTYFILEMREQSAAGDKYRRIQRWAPFAFKSEKGFVYATTEIVKLLPKQ